MTQPRPQGLTMETMNPSGDDFLKITGLKVSFPSADPKSAEVNTVLDGVDLAVSRGEFVTIIGQSGCGKSTLLNCIAGLEQSQSGTITLEGRSVKGPGPDRVVVFQQASLFPWRTVEDNVAFGPQIRRWNAGDTERRVSESLDMVGLRGYEKHFPHQISGGMQQRVNLARALVMDAAVILMDEPFGALDAMTKRNMQDELLRVQSLVGSTVVFITHDIDEAVYLGDRVVAMSRGPGRIHAIHDVPFSRPRSRAVIDTHEFREIARAVDAELRPSH